MAHVPVNIPVLGEKGSVPANAITTSITDLAGEINGGLDNTNLRSKGVVQLAGMARTVNVQTIPVNLTVNTGGLHVEPDFVSPGSTVASTMLPSVQPNELLLVSVGFSWSKTSMPYVAEMFPVLEVPSQVVWQFTRTTGNNGTYGVGFNGGGVENGVAGQLVVTWFAGQQLNLKILTEKITFPPGFVLFPEWDQFHIGTVTVTTEKVGF